MQQKQLAAYLRLIQDLLSCPQGEEWIHLKRYESLVDAQFVQIMEHVAAQLERKGHVEAATFLNNWAAKLHHIFFKEVQPASPEEDSSEAYLDFIEKLSYCPKELEDELIADHRQLIGPGLVHKMREIARAHAANGDVAAARSLEKRASQLNQMWIREHNFKPSFQKQPEEYKVSAQVPAQVPVGAASVGNRLKEISVAPDASSQVAEKQSNPDAPVPIGDSHPLVDDLHADLWGGSDEQDAVATLTPDTTPLIDAEDTPLSSDSTVDEQLGQAGTQAIAKGLNAIATALQQLNQTLLLEKEAEQASSHLSEDDFSRPPLAHLEALEQACNADWQLTTEEVEQLIGVRPRCHDKETVYHRGNWRFTKVGHLGSQTAWQVSKEPY